MVIAVSPADGAFSERGAAAALRDYRPRSPHGLEDLPRVLVERRGLQPPMVGDDIPAKVRHEAIVGAVNRAENRSPRRVATCLERKT
jgi:hypothetical protein